MITPKSLYKCPKCNKVGKWRSGVGFEHEMRCSNCNIVWDPEEHRYYNEELTKSLINVQGDDI